MHVSSSIELLLIVEISISYVKKNICMGISKRIAVGILGEISTGISGEVSGCIHEQLLGEFLKLFLEESVLWNT